MNRPTITELIHALRIVAEATGACTVTYCFEGRFRFRLAGGWALVVSTDDAGRFRLDACVSGRTRASMWSLAGDDARLAELASAAQREAAALAA